MAVKLERFPLDGNPRVTQWYGDDHIGIDYSVPERTPVYATHSGKVVCKNQPHGFGQVINVEHPDGWMTTYAHLSEFKKNSGDQVQAGSVIGLSGNTGESTGPHLHFGLRLPGWSMNDGKYGYSDPKPYLPGVPLEEALNRFGFYFLRRVDAYAAYLAAIKPAWTVVHECSKAKVDAVRAASPNTKVIGRLYKSDQWFTHAIETAPIAAANQVATELHNSDWAEHVDCVLTSNEVCMRWDQLDNLNTYYLELQKLWHHPIGLYSMSVENLPWDKEPWHESLMLHWQKLYPSMRAGLDHKDYLLIHQYNAPRLWLEGQSQKPPGQNLNLNRIVRFEEYVHPHLPADLQTLPAIVSEFGWDFLLWPFNRRRGWLDDEACDDGVDAVKQLNNFATLWDARYSQVPVQGWVFFCVEDSGGWEFYQAQHDTTPSGVKRTPLIKLMADTKPGGPWYPSHHEITPPEPPEPPVEPPVEPPKPPPEEPDMQYPRVYDAHGVEQDWDWLTEHYGNLIYQPAQGLQHGEQYWKLVRMQENRRDPVTKIRTIDEQGQPHSGNNATFHWPDAPRHESGCASHWDKNFKYQSTDSQGYTSFAMGTGSYYWPPDIGVHKVWICGGTKSDMIQGIGMLSGTDHHNVADLVFALTTYDAQNPPPPNPDPDPVPPPSDALKEIAMYTKTIADAQAEISGYLKELRDYIVKGVR